MRYGVDAWVLPAQGECPAVIYMNGCNIRAENKAANGTEESDRKYKNTPLPGHPRTAACAVCGTNGASGAKG